MAKKKNNAFTIIELLVAMALLVLMLGLSGMVFQTTVEAHRTAGASVEITRRLRAITDQLNTDFRGLRKDGEFFLAWRAAPELDENNVIIDENGDTIPDNYIKFDRIVFFADGDFQTYRPQNTTTLGVTKQVSGNLARISYMHAKKSDGTKAELISNRKRRILARTEHIVTADIDLPLFPDPADLIVGTWDPTVFDTANYSNYEYQTMSMADWTNISNPASLYVQAKSDIMTILTDVLDILSIGNSAGVTTGGPVVETDNPATYHNYFSEGVADFGIQIWDEINQRWYPQIDPNGDGDYSDSDYPLDGSEISQTVVNGRLTFDENGFTDLVSNGGVGQALKFTFTLYDSHGVFPNGKTFTHIVLIDN